LLGDHGRRHVADIDGLLFLIAESYVEHICEPRSSLQAVLAEPVGLRDCREASALEVTDFIVTVVTDD